MAAQRPRSVPLQATLLLILLLALLPPLVWFQFQWTGVVSANEERRMRENLRATGLQFLLSLENEVTIIHELFDAETLGGDPAGLARRVEAAVRFWEESSAWPGLLESISLVEAESAPAAAAAPLTRVRPALPSPGPGQAWFVLLDPSLAPAPRGPALPDGAEGAGQAAFILSRYQRDAQGAWRWNQEKLGANDPLLRRALASVPLFQGGDEAEAGLPLDTLPLEFPRLASFDPLVLMVSRVSAQNLTRDILPALFARYFQGGDGLAGYRIRLVERKPARVLWDSLGDPAAEPPGDEAVLRLPLFNDWRVDSAQSLRTAEGRSPDFPRIRYWLRTNERPPERNARSAWTLEFYRVDGSFEDAADRIRWLNFGASLALIVLFAAGLSYIYKLYRQSRTMVRAQEDFVATVSHELKTPLSVLRAAAENLREGVVTEVDHAKRYGERMVHEAERLLGMTENVLRYARLEAGGREALAKNQRFDLSQLCREAVQAWKPEFARAQASLQFHPGILGSARFSGDREAIRALIDNLLSNARRYGLATEHPPQSGQSSPDAPAGPTKQADQTDQAKHPEPPGAAEAAVRLSLELHFQAARFRLLPPARIPAREWYRLVVEDHGPGIPRAFRAKLFHPFARPDANQSGGVGLGLALVRRIASAHGGRVWLDPAAHAGARFVVELPRRVEDLDPPADPAPAKPPEDDRP